MPVRRFRNGSYAVFSDGSRSRLLEEFAWFPSNKDVVIVEKGFNGTGLVIPKGQGSATINLDYKGLRSEVQVNVLLE